MRAVILAGGKGTRLRPYTTVIPKPLVPVGEKPILEILLSQLRAAGVTHVTITVNHLAELIMAFFGHGERLGMKIDYSLEETPLGTVGPVKLIRDLPDDFFVLNGDLLMDLDFTGLLHAHLESEAKLTVAAYRRDANIDFGVIDTDESGAVVGFREKPTFNFLVSTGAYVYNRSLLQLVPDGVPFGFDQLMLSMLDLEEPINVFRHEGYWLDIGRPEDYERANLDLQSVIPGGTRT